MNDCKRFCKVEPLKPIPPIKLRQSIIMSESFAIYGTTAYEFRMNGCASCNHHLLNSDTIGFREIADKFLLTMIWLSRPLTNRELSFASLDLLESLCP